MSKYKAGDKVVLEMLSIDGDGYYIVGSEHYSWWASPKNLDEVVEPLSAYTEPLEAKIRRQAAEITRLLKENAELKKGREAIRDNAFEAGLIRGQQEAWELARKCMLMTDREREAIFGSGHNALYGVLTYFDYKHAAAKVAEWERKKEEICVGDVVKAKCDERVEFCVTEIDYEGRIYGISSKGRVYSDRRTEYWEKTGRHIDMSSVLAQIGGDQNG